MNKFFLNQLKQQFFPEIPQVLEYLKSEAASTADSLSAIDDKETLANSLFFELAVFNIYAASYAATVRLRDRHPEELEDFLKQYENGAIEKLETPPFSRPFGEEGAIRRFFYEKLMGRFPKSHVFVAQSVGLIVDMTLAKSQDAETVKSMVQVVGRLATILLERYMGRFKKVLFMGRDNRFVMI